MSAACSTSRHDLCVFDLHYVWVHAGVHTHVCAQWGRNAAGPNFPETRPECIKKRFVSACSIHHRRLDASDPPYFYILNHSLTSLVK